MRNNFRLFFLPFLLMTLISRETLKILIVGNPDPNHIGRHFYSAAKEINLDVLLSDSSKAYSASWFMAKFYWWVRKRYPPLLKKYSQEVLNLCRAYQPHFLLSTGIAPIQYSVLEKIGKLNIKKINYLTDNPWNPALEDSWFKKSLCFYDYVFSRRRSNLDELNKLGCKGVYYLPFAYAPEAHFIQFPENDLEKRKLSSDVMFAGGGDADRIKIIKALTKTNLNIALYGGYWDRFSQTKTYARGMLKPVMLCKAVNASKIVLCLVRRGNRDGHTMRTFEAAAMGACMLVEDTLEHREILGEEGESVLYFNNNQEMLEKISWLLMHDDERKRLSETVRKRIMQGEHTYRDRLAQMFTFMSQE